LVLSLSGHVSVKSLNNDKNRANTFLLDLLLLTVRLYQLIIKTFTSRNLASNYPRAHINMQALAL